MTNIYTIASGSSGNCYAVECNGEVLLIECGVPIKRIKEWFFSGSLQMARIIGCLVSHEHKDHSAACDAMSHLSILNFGSNGTADAVGGLFYRMHELDTHRIHHGWYAMGFNVQHDAEEPFGFIIDTPDGSRIAYITDTHYVKYAMPDDLTHIMIEANYADEILDANIDNGSLNERQAERARTNHMSLTRVLAFLKATNLDAVKEIILLHLSSANSDERHFKAEVEKYTGIPTRTS